MIIINGISYSGNNITIQNGKVIVDGKNLTPEDKEINILIEGNIDSVKVDYCNELLIKGDAGNISTVSGDVSVLGKVTGSIMTTSGDVDCTTISGNVSTVSGDIKTRNK